MSAAIVSQPIECDRRHSQHRPGGHRLLMAGSAPPPPSAAAVAAERPVGYGAFGVVWSATDPRDGKSLAVKKMPKVFQNVVSARRAYRELSFLHRVQHDNVASFVCVLEERNFPQEIYLVCELMQTDLHKIIVSSQPLTVDHVKIFLYQTLRGLKYLHSANILHRDMKPGNLLVNSDCHLRICDFGLARVDDPNSTTKKCLTLEVVTQYYRAPELLMGAVQYSTAIDVWSVGCIFAELLSRSILFQASSPLSQLELILSLLGTPDPSDLSLACSAAKRYVLGLPRRLPKLASAMWGMSRTVTEDGLHLLEHLLRFNPEHRATAAAALSHPYLSEARVRYHACMCDCCSRQHQHQHQHQHQQESHLEPTCRSPMPDTDESAIVDVDSADRQLRLLLRRLNSRDRMGGRQPLRLNWKADNLLHVQRSGIAASSELPPSPHRW